MILQYKGFNNNWIYEEAETITHAVVWVGKETRDYREGGVRHSLKYSGEYMRGRSKEEVDLAYVNEMHKAIDKLIKEETHCCDDIAYHIGSLRFDEMENVVVITLQDKHKYVTRVFAQGGGVYLLNSRGQTVQKLA